MSRDPTIISADSHVVEPLDLWRRALGNRFGDEIPHQLGEHKGEKGRFLFTGRQVLRLPERGGAVSDDHRDLYESGFIPEKRLSFQERAGIRAEVLYGSYMLVIMQSPHRAALRASCEVFNDWLAEFCSCDTGKLLGTGMIPIDDVDWAIRELERTAKKGLRGACINVALPPDAKPYRDAVYDPFWARAVALDMPLTLHSITGTIIDPFYPRTQREREEGPGTLLALSYEAQATLANDFIFGGILDRHPNLKLICSEFEINWVPFFCWKTDHMAARYVTKMSLPMLKKKPSEYMGTQIWHGVIGDPLTTQSINFLGTDMILWGSDFPHVRSVGLNTRESLNAQFAAFSAADRDKLVGGNVARLYDIR